MVVCAERFRRQLVELFLAGPTPVHHPMNPFTLVVFGITGNLFQIKLLPALKALDKQGLLPKDTKIIGIGRRNLRPGEFGGFESKITYLPGDFEDQSPTNPLYPKLSQLLGGQGESNWLYYLATYPEHYAGIFSGLNDLGLTSKKNGWVRVMIEKPMGHDLKSAQQLNKLLSQYFTEDQIYRLDHYLAKETMQNILVFRFGNEIFQSLLNKNFVDNIQVTVAEDFGVGNRGGYYDSMGALRDIGQNHLLQMLVMVTMEAPSEFANQPITNERIAVLKKLQSIPDSLVLGQYNGYVYEDKINPQSTADTFFAFKTEISSRRWVGVPVYVRGGKRLAKTVAEISIVFKTPKNSLFTNHELGNNPNVLTYRLQPNEGIGIEVLTKYPGHKLLLDKSYLQFCYSTKKNQIVDPYQKLIYDAISGDQTLFNDALEVETAWQFIDDLKKGTLQPKIYEPGTWGPKEADDLIQKDGRHWIEPSDALCVL